MRAAPALHTALHWQLTWGEWLKGADKETKQATEPTHSRFFFHQIKTAANSQGCMFISSCCEYSRVLHLWTSLHPNAYLYSGVVVRAGADKAFGASIHRPWGIAISSLVDLHGAKSLPRQTGPGPGHGDIWLVCGSGAGCQGCRQHSS